MGLLRELFRVRRYKESQGRFIRRLTMSGVWILFAVGAWKCTQMDFTYFAGMFGLQGAAVAAFPYAVGTAVLFAGLWFGYRLVNWAAFADFLISVEAEMVKVSWPGRAEVRSSTIVVLTVFVMLAMMIYLFDLIWVFVFRITGVV